MSGSHGLISFLKGTYIFKNGNLYKGSTDNIEKRIVTHNAGKVKYSSKHLPWKVVLSEEFETRSEAMKREKWYKTDVGRR